MSAPSVYAALGLIRNPFPPAPDAGSYFFTPQLEEEFSEIAHCIQARKGFVLLTGEVGLGKSTLVRRLLDTLPGEECRSALILNTFLQGEELLTAILSDFGLAPAPGLDAGLARLNAFSLNSRQQGKTCLLIVDDAQNLSVPSLELIRLLCNLETDQDKLLQILLVGQPELEQTLATPGLRQLKSRIVKHARLRGLHKDELARYFDFRVNAAGGAGRLTVQPAAAELLHNVTAGNLRLLHLVLDRCLYGLAAARQTLVDTALVRKAIADVPSLGGEATLSTAATARSSIAPRTWVLAGLSMGIVTVAAAAWMVGTGHHQRVGEAAAPDADTRVSDATSAAHASAASASAFRPETAAPRVAGPATRSSCEARLQEQPATGQFIEYQTLPGDIAARVMPSPRVCLFRENGQDWAAWVSTGSVRHIQAAQQVIRTAQHALIQQGYLKNMAPDGMLGPRTGKALAGFQQRQGIPPTGRLDETTFFLLENIDVASR